MQIDEDQIISDLERYGFATLKQVVSSADCAAMEKEFNRLEENQNYGEAFNDNQRLILWNLHRTCPDTFLNKINVPPVMNVVKKVLQDTFCLTTFAGIRNKGVVETSNLHIDSRVPMRDFEHTFQVIAMFCVTDFTAENGATYLWPYSHKTGQNPKATFPKNFHPPGRVQCEGKAGDILLFLGQTWHDVAPNLTDQKRWGLIAYYSRWWIKPDFDFTQCGEDVFKRLTDEQKVLLGFTVRPPLHAKGRINTVMKIQDLPKTYEEALKS